MPRKELVITTSDNDEYSGYLTLPKKAQGIGIVLLHEIYGINKSICEVADNYAQEGFAVVVPDLFWRLKPHVKLDYSDLDEAFEYYHHFNLEQGIQDVEAAVNTLREHPSCNGVVASLGFSFGGKLSFLLAAKQAVDAAVAFYGNGIVEHLDAAENISSPLQLHFAEEDEIVPLEQVEQIRRALQDDRKKEIYLYPDAEHGFYDHLRPCYDAKAAELSQRRTLKFLNHLR